MDPLAAKPTVDYTVHCSEKDRIATLHKASKTAGVPAVLSGLAQHFSRLIVSTKKDDIVTANILLSDLFTFYKDVIEFSKELEAPISRATNEVHPTRNE